MASTTTLSEYLFTRLRQLGVLSIHGVPGDYNLTLLDYVEPSGLNWVGNSNELNAAYAADGYARTRGKQLGAVITTFGVGELSAINAIAGAYAEFAPVVHIVGSPTRSNQESRLKIHHTFNDGEYRRFALTHAQVTVAQAYLHEARTAAEQIDFALQECLLKSRPVYIEVPVDMVDAPISTERLAMPITIPDSLPSKSFDTTLTKIMEKIHAAKNPVIIVDGECRPLRLTEDVQKFVKTTKWPTWATPFSKGLLDETVSNFHGIYRGSFDDAPVKDFINKADLVVNFGPHHSSTNTFAYTSKPNPELTISFTTTGVSIGNEQFRDIPTREILARLVSSLDVSKLHRYEPYPELPRDYATSISDCKGTITQKHVWNVLANFLKPGDILMGETGTSGYGVRVMPLPKDVQVFNPVTWLSIGYMLPAAQGAALAQRELVEAGKWAGSEKPRTILFIGDGSFQMTAQELGTIIRLNLDVIVFLVNNDGYTIERCINGRNQGYNDVARWRYLDAPNFFGAAEDTFTGSATTYEELDKLISNEQLISGKGLRMAEIFMTKEDAPEGPLKHLLEMQKAKEGKTTK
ncbi:pyruvate decarboxylase [Myriangium duriaei CBS 260.36]|uniref:Pyruvate decarboxylase n=1 Tax=Myriangium duriaei CBS 260.36 TaxID=1168546 RepID=A0A9P4IZS0_9PEZI|nr:pyruvate decarboxylase [Myriangium duriaei CBS 260.36]